MAARLRRELQTDVDQVHGRYGEFKVLVDGVTVVDPGAKAIVGILPSAHTVIEKVRAHIAASAAAGAGGE